MDGFHANIYRALTATWRGLIHRPLPNQLANREEGNKIKSTQHSLSISHKEKSCFKCSVSHVLQKIEGPILFMFKLLVIVGKL